MNLKNFIEKVFNNKLQKESVRSLSPSRMAVMQKRKMKRILLVSSAVLMTIVFILVIFICKSCSDDTVQQTKDDLLNAELGQIQGLWHYDDHTEYEFDGKGSGRMFYEKDKFFAYTYTIDQDDVTLDFELDYVTDCKYTFNVEGDKLTLIGGEGTAVIGKVYELFKTDDY